MREKKKRILVNAITRILTLCTLELNNNYIYDLVLLDNNSYDYDDFIFYISTTYYLVLFTI